MWTLAFWYHDDSRTDARLSSILSALRPTAYKATCPPPACGSRQTPLHKVNRTRYRKGRPHGRLSYFQPPAFSMADPFPKGTFKVTPAPCDHPASGLFIPTQPP